MALKNTSIAPALQELTRVYIRMCVCVSHSVVSDSL